MSEENVPNEAIQKKDKRRNTVLTVLSFVFLIAGALWILSLFFDFERNRFYSNGL